MACGVAMNSLQRAQAGSRSSGRCRQAKAQRDATRAVVLQAATAEAASLSEQAEMAGHVRSRHQRLS
jgi:hypothetical protein